METTSKRAVELLRSSGKVAPDGRPADIILEQPTSCCGSRLILQCSGVFRCPCGQNQEGAAKSALSKQELGEHGFPICPHCHNEADPDTCWCGDPIIRHGMESGHSPVPHGCTCGSAKQESL